MKIVVPPITEQFLAQQKGIPAEDAARLLLGDVLYEALGTRLVTYKSEYADARGVNAPIFQGVSETLEQLTQSGLMLAVVTSARKDFCEKILDRKKELRLVKDKAVYRESYKKGKPAADALEAAARILGCAAENILYVGDALADSLAAQAANTLFVQFNAVSVFDSAHHIRRHADLPALLEDLQRVSSRRIKAVAYDLDGTLIDTADIHAQAWRQAVQKLNLASI